MQYREANIIAAALIASAANGDQPKIWDLIEGFEYALQELEERQKERQRWHERDQTAM